MKRILIFALMLCATMTAMAVAEEDKFCIAKDGKAATIVVDENDWKGVIRAANDLGDDVRKVTGVAAPIANSQEQTANCIIVGTIGKSKIIDKFIKQKKLDVKRIKGHSQVAINEAPFTVSMIYPSGLVYRPGTGWLMCQ